MGGFKLDYYIINMYVMNNVLIYCYEFGFYFYVFEEKGLYCI